jgi:hypothetical protein
MSVDWRTLTRYPLTDIRSLGSSLVFHGLLLLAASLVVVAALVPGEKGPPGLLGAVDDPVDNRADLLGPGGGPGDLGGTLTPDQARPNPTTGATAAPASAAPPTPADAIAEAIVDDILAMPSPATPPSQPPPPTDLTALSAPSAGVGTVPGQGTGGGGGQGGGSGGGTGLGLGAGTEFFGARERASSFAYVIDCSSSMTNRNSLGIAKRELLASLRRLPPDARFGVVFYNERPTPFLDPAGKPQLMPATAQNKGRFEDRLSVISPDGGTDHVDALLAAFEMKPEVIFFLTDADLMTDREANDLSAAAGPIRIQAVEFGVGPDTGSSVPLRSLATATGGTYRYIDVMTFPSLGP